MLVIIQNNSMYGLVTETELSNKNSKEYSLLCQSIETKGLPVKSLEYYRNGPMRHVLVLNDSYIVKMTGFDTTLRKYDDPEIISSKIELNTKTLYREMSKQNRVHHLIKKAGMNKMSVAHTLFKGELYNHVFFVYEMVEGVNSHTGNILDLVRKDEKFLEVIGRDIGNFLTLLHCTDIGFWTCHTNVSDNNHSRMLQPLNKFLSTKDKCALGNVMECSEELKSEIPKIKEMSKKILNDEEFQIHAKGYHNSLVHNEWFTGHFLIDQDGLKGALDWDVSCIDINGLYDLFVFYTFQILEYSLFSGSELSNMAGKDIDAWDGKSTNQMEKLWNCIVDNYIDVTTNEKISDHMLNIIQILSGVMALNSRWRGHKQYKLPRNDLIIEYLMSKEF